MSGAAGALAPYYITEGVRVFNCDARTIPLDAESVQTCITSPPYYGLRDYGVAPQIGLEQTPEQYVAALVDVFREVWRVLKPDGTLWMNLGDTYAASRMGGNPVESEYRKQATNVGSLIHGRKAPPGLKPKDLIGIPWMVAFALRADGWYLRSDIIWAKPNPMPESVTDRPTKAHEYIFLLSKSDRYYYDAAAVAEAATGCSGGAGFGKVNLDGPGSRRISAEDNNRIRGRGGANAFRGQGHFRTTKNGPANRDGRDMRDVGTGPTRNRRSVWTVTTTAYPGAHFAAWPPALVEPCVLAGSRMGDVVLDPFSGSGTTGEVARRLGRQYVGIELNADYIELQKDRLRQGCLFGRASA